jgi:hypothetical protein
MPEDILDYTKRTEGKLSWAERIQKEIDAEEEEKRREWAAAHWRKRFTFRYWLGRFSVCADFGDYGIFSVPIMILTFPFLVAYTLADRLWYGERRLFLRAPGRLECVCRVLVLTGIAAALCHWVAGNSWGW